MRPVRVLIVDDSAVVRSILTKRFIEAGLEVMGAAADPYVARDMIFLKKPEVLTLDLEMPRMDGLTFLDRLMTHYPMPVVVLSSLTEARSEMALQALELGAIDVIAKPSSGVNEELAGDNFKRLIESVYAAGAARPRRRTLKGQQGFELGKRRNPIEITSNKVVAIGASTGGTEALAEVLESLPGDHPGVLVAQHMPPYFTKSFADRLDKRCALRVREARTGDEVKDGTVLIAPGDFHMILRRTGSKYQVECRRGPLVHHVRPSVDVLFQSVAQAAGPNAVGVILTGMGKDGAEGLLSMRMAGAATLAQDKESCVVYGMPKEALDRGAVKEVVPLDQMAETIQLKIKKMISTATAIER